MKVFILCMAVLCLVGCGVPSNYAGCIVENMGGVQNQHSAAAVRRECSSKYPKGYDEIEVGSGNGLFGHKTRDECIMKYGKNIMDRNASVNVNYACGCLYREPEYKGQKCSD